MEEIGFTLEGRVLCGDDACVGTIGPDKRCKLCGKPYEGDAEVGSEAPRAASEGDKERSGAADEVRADPTSPVEYGGAPDGRTCCPDDACIGIIGPGGVCGVCGKSHSKKG